MATKKPIEWTSSRLAAMLKVPKRHPHPSVTGFILEVSPKFMAVYRWRFREGDNGTYGECAEVVGDAGITLEKALALHAEKLDSRKAKKNRGGELKLGQAFKQWLTDSEVRGGGKKSKTTVEYYSEMYTRYLEEEYSEFILADQKTDDWKRVLDPVLVKSKSSAKGTYWMLHSIYNHFIELEKLAVNPLSKQVMRNRFAGKASKTERTTHVQAIQLETFYKGIESIANRGHGKKAVEFLLFTGWRISAVLQMQWKHVNNEHGYYEIPEGAVGWKGHRGIIPLNAGALKVLEDRRAKGGEDESEYVFPSYGDNAKNPFMVNVYGSVKRASEGLGWLVKPHDLRRTFATIGEVALDGDSRMVGKLIAHKQPGESAPTDASAITQSYIIGQFATERAATMQVGEAIRQLSGLVPLTAELKNKFSKRGLDLENLALIDMEDDESA